MTADHIEHGFKAIGEAQKKPGLQDLSKVIDRIFVFSFCSIIVSDGKERAGLFLERQSGYTSFPPEFIGKLGEIEEYRVDEYPEISQFLMSPMSHELSCDFYTNLNNYLDENQIWGMIYLLKHFLHNKPFSSTKAEMFVQRHGGSWRTAFPSTDPILPFTESNVPQIVHRPHHYHEFKVVRKIPTLIVKHPGVRPPHLPSLVNLTVPQEAMGAAIHTPTCAVVYFIANELVYISPRQEVRKLSPHTTAVSTVTFSECGCYVLSGDVCGDVQIESLCDGRVVRYKEVGELVTAVAFSSNMFALGTMSGRVLVFETNCLHPKRVFVYHSSTITFLALHKNCDILASASADGSIRLFELGLGVCVRVWKSGRHIPLSCRYSFDGKLLLVACDEGDLMIIDMGSGKVVRMMTIEASVIDAAFSPNDQLIVVADKTGGLSLWDVNDLTGESLIVLRIDKIRPLSLWFLNEDLIMVLGCESQTRFFDDGLNTL
jgi:WD40 repeat protein